MSASDSAALSTDSNTDVHAGADLTAAIVISYVVNPLVLPPILFALALGHVGAPPTDVVTGTGVGLLFFCVIPLAHVVWLRTRGQVESLEVRDRAKRTGPLFVGIASGTAALLSVLALDLTGGRLLAALIACHVVNTAMLALVTVRWKISIHCTALAGVAGALVFVHLHVPGSILTTPLGTILVGGGLALVPLLAWARVRSGAHTAAQVVAGSAFGGLAPYVELILVSRFGWL